VDVREAGPMERLRARIPRCTRPSPRNAAPELACRSSRWSATSPAGDGAARGSRGRRARAGQAQSSVYAAANAPLQASSTPSPHSMPAPMRMPQLKSFFAGVKSRSPSACTISPRAYFADAAGIAHGEEASEPGARSFRRPTAPSINRCGDARRLAAALDRGWQFAWALEQRDPEAAAWIFPSAYHIKGRQRRHGLLAVERQLEQFQSTRTSIPSTTRRAPVQLKVSDRDWHVIASIPALAALFEHYLQHDLDGAIAAPGAGRPSRRRWTR